MTVDTWLLAAQKQLLKAGITTARLDSLVLLEDCLERDRAGLLAHPDTEVTSEQLALLATALQRRAQHEPLAYIRGRSEFYGRDFLVNQHVLVPRPESETMIELLKKLQPAGPLADIGTGCGALAITAALETGALAAAVDIDEAALAVAMRNASLHRVPLQCLQDDLLEPFLNSSAPFTPNVLLCNLPYVPTAYPINQAAQQEPPLALFGGEDGLDVYRRLFAQTAQLSKQPQLILTEALPEQHSALGELAKKHGYAERSREDFIQAFTPAA